MAYWADGEDHAADHRGRPGLPDTNASFWRIIFSPAGPGHVLYLKSELTENKWRIYADNIAMARWLDNRARHAQRRIGRHDHSRR